MFFKSCVCQNRYTNFQTVSSRLRNSTAYLSLKVTAQQALQPFSLKKLGHRRYSQEEETPLRPSRRNWSCVLWSTLIQEDWVPAQGIRPVVGPQCVSILGNKNQWQQSSITCRMYIQNPQWTSLCIGMFFLDFTCLCLIYKLSTTKD